MFIIITNILVVMDDKFFFDKLAQTWDDNEVLSTPAKIREILSYMDIRPGDKILDLGTGTGVLLPFIAEKIGESGKITAVDYSEEMLKRARHKFSNLNPVPEFLNLDFENENINGEFDKIILYCVYPHLHTPVETLKWLKKVNLKPGGRIYIAFPCDNSFINNIHKEKHSDSDALPSPPALSEMLNKEGLESEVICDTPSSYVVSVK